MTKKAAITQQAEETIERAVKTYSKQPRHSEDEAQVLINALYRYTKEFEIERVAYSPQSSTRDAWLRDWAKKEPYWQAVLRGCAMLDANRGWSYVGGRNQVNRFTQTMHNANDGGGWRGFSMVCSNSFRQSDLGAITELGRDGKNGPVRAIYNVDPVQCELTGKIKTPLKYTPSQGGEQPWRPSDYMRAVSNPSTDERYRGLGWCATSAAFELIVIMYGILLHDEEAIGARFPKGLLLLKGITEKQWTDALSSRQRILDSKDQARFGGVMVLATGGDLTPEAVLTAFSELPAGFDRQTFLEQTWYGYAAIVGRDASEFFPVQTGSIGRGNEPDVQHRKATRKGGAEFILAWQEQWQQQLPSTLHFEFDEKDDEGELIEAEVAAAWTEVATAMYQAGGSFAAPPITTEQYLTFLVEHGVIPPEWTETMEEEESTDLEAVRERYRARVLQNPNVATAVRYYINEPIVRYHWRGGLVSPTERILWNSGMDALRPRLWRSRRILRQDDGDVLYSDDEMDFQITTDDVDRALRDGAKAVPPGDDEQTDPGLGVLFNAQEVEERSLRESLTRLFGRRNDEKRAGTTKG